MIDEYGQPAGPDVFSLMVKYGGDERPKEIKGTHGITIVISKRKKE